MSDNSNPQRPPLRIIGLLKKKEGMSTEEFRRYWKDVHAVIFRETEVVKRVVKRYEQLHPNDELMRMFAGAGAPAGDWDGVAVVEVESGEKFFEMTQDEEYKSKVVPDEKNFMDSKELVVYAADVVRII